MVETIYSNNTNTYANIFIYIIYLICNVMEINCAFYSAQLAANSGGQLPDTFVSNCAHFAPGAARCTIYNSYRARYKNTILFISSISYAKLMNP